LSSGISEHQEHLSETVVKSIFKEIRYPLISEVDLFSKVRPTKLADSYLYSAALEYHIFPDQYEGPSIQITNRKLVPQNIKYINANYLCMVVCENDGLNICKTDGVYGWNALCAILVCPTSRQPVCFKIVVIQALDNDSGHLYLATQSHDDRVPHFQVDRTMGGMELHNLCDGQEIDGVVSVRGDDVVTTINGVTNYTTNTGIIYFCIHMFNQNDEILFSFT